MSTSFTPGPWEARPRDKLSGETYVKRGQYTIARVEGGGYPSDAEANARLIAAAPELLEALLTLFQAVPDSDSEPLKAANAQARAAIAKARG